LHPARSDLRLGSELEPAALEQSAKLESSVTFSGSGGLGASENGLRLDELAGFYQRGPEVWRHLDPAPLVVKQKDGRSREQAGRGSGVAAGECPSACRSQQLCRA
jgi:hypothetical protein